MATGGRTFDDDATEYGSVGGTHSSLEQTTATLAGWIKNPNVALSMPFFECLSAGFQGYRFSWQRGGFTNRFTLYDSTDWRFSGTTTGVIDDGGWHHIAVTFTTGGNVKFYLDGVQLGSTQTAGTMGTAGGATKYFGRDDTNYMQCELSEWAFWDSILSDADILNLALGDSPQAHSCDHHWRFNETGTTITDEVGDCDLTMVNTPGVSSDGPPVDEPPGSGATSIPDDINELIEGGMFKNVSGQKIGCQMTTIADGTPFTGSVTVYVTGDAGTQGAGSVGAGACTHEGNGYHTYAPAQAETNYDQIAFTFVGTGAYTKTIQVYTGVDAVKVAGAAPENSSDFSSAVNSLTSEGLTLEERIAVILAAVAGKSPTPSGGVRKYRNVADSKDRISVSASAGDRGAPTFDFSDL